MCQAAKKPKAPEGLQVCGQGYLPKSMEVCVAGVFVFTLVELMVTREGLSQEFGAGLLWSFSHDLL